MTMKQSLTTNCIIIFSTPIPDPLTATHTVRNIIAYAGNHMQDQV
jgi:hypothetical protein